MLIDEKLEYWKKRLLDLGKRNRLINSPLPSEGKRVQRHSLLISAPTPALLWTLLAEDDGDLLFPLPVENMPGEQFELLEAASDRAGPYIKTNQTHNETHKTLRNLMKKSKEFTEEKGLNALHLAFGFLNWKENGTEGQEIRSPLLLLPVRLSQEDLFSPIILSRFDEEVSANHSLEQKLLGDFNIKLPPLTEDTELSDYLSDILREVMALGWSVSNDVAQLSLFSFMKINMYRDLERNSDKIREHHIIRAINGEAFRDETTLSGITEYDHDNSDPQEVYSVLDADSSQQDAIQLAKRGVSFVLQGPPGTGKSQTIANIIAELIAEGKKVLFVSEKTAALEVVYKRLTQVELSNFCLTLHSHKAKRRDILDQLDNSIKMSRMKIELQQDAYNSLYRLKETRTSLNQYNTELHTIVGPLNKTIFQVNGFLAQLEDCRNIDYVQEKAETFTSELLAKCESALEEVTRIVSKSGYQQNNPWNGCVLEQPPTFEFRQRFLVDAAHLVTLVEEGLAIFDETNTIFDNHNLEWSFSSTASIRKVFEIAKLSPKVNSTWVTLNLPFAISSLDACVSYVGDCETLENDMIKMQVIAEHINSAMHNETTIQCEQEYVAEVFSAVEEYNRTLDDFDSSKNEKANVVATKEELQKKLLDSEQVFEEEALENDRLRVDWQTAQTGLFEHCAEDVMLLDATNMLIRYRTDYRAWTRIFNFTYRNDRKRLLSYCRMAEKLTYEQGLMLLDEIVNVQTLKAVFDEQAEITTYAQILFEETKLELDDVSEKLSTAVNVNVATKSKFSTSKATLTHIVSDVLSGFEQRLCEHKRLFSTTQHCISLRNDLDMDITEDTDFEALRKKIEWCADFQTLIIQYKFGNGFTAAVCGGDVNIFNKAEANLAKLQNWTRNMALELKKFADLFDKNGKVAAYQMPLLQLHTHIADCKENFANLEYLIDYRIANARLRSLGIDAFLEKVKEINLDADEIVPVFKKCFFRSWLDVIIPNYTAISEFRGLRQDERVVLFKNLDKSHLDISKAMLISILTSHLPNFDVYSSNDEMAILRREMAKQRKLMPIRLLIAALPNLLPALKPCIMMSPLSVSTYLGSSNFEFDTVIFDEASQVRTEDAIGAIFRAKQAIIVGDSRQLPPTDFFSASMSTSDDYEVDEDGEINDVGAYESLLDEATMLPIQTLLWHYRSRHENLIAFSNAKIYQGNLITFPSPAENVNGMGVEYVHVRGGTYDRGGRNGNRAEAEKVAELVFEHLCAYPNRSLGIIAFGEIQQSAIQDALIIKRRANPNYEPFFKEDKEEALFIKNLETVQGDERDTIIFSIGYAPDASGKFIMNFGPLSRDGGERRLNVAVTRARFNMKMVGSIMPTDIDVERTSGQGPKLLRLYIDFARYGANALLGETTEYNSLWFDSPFESSVYAFLVANGFDVVTQVGCSGYRIDMAVRHPKYNGRFALGIECDGAMYHSARTARERDRLRQTVLEDMGWNIYRVWSTDWIKDRNSEGARLLSAVRYAIENYSEIYTNTNNSTDKLTSYANIITQTATERMQEGISEKSQTLRSQYYGRKASEISTSNIAEVMLNVVASGFGLNKTGLFRETALYGYGWKQQGRVIKSKFEETYAYLRRQNQIEEDSDGKVSLTTTVLEMSREV